MAKNRQENLEKKKGLKFTDAMINIKLQELQ